MDTRTEVRVIEAADNVRHIAFSNCAGALGCTAAIAGLGRRDVSVALRASSRAGAPSVRVNVKTRARAVVPPEGCKGQQPSGERFFGVSA